MVRVRELVVHFAEEVRVVDGVRIEAGGDQRALVPDGREPRVDGGDIRGRDGDETRLVKVPALEIAEIKSAIPKQRAAQARAVLRLSQWQRGVRYRVI